MDTDEEERPTGILNRVLSFAIMVVVVLGCAFLLDMFVIKAYAVPSGSMEDTIMTGDRVLAEKVSFHFEPVQAGEIITFTDPEDSSRTLIKRVIATGGQTVDLKDGYVYINGVKQDEPYTDGKKSYPLSQTVADVSYPYTVPDGYVWVMGDNRTNSADSRYFGAIPTSSITGHAIFRYWPVNTMSAIS